VEAFATLNRVLSVEINAAAENPLVDGPTAAMAC
jgi:hypothetical protein